jgi:hypothetical protein
VILRGYGEHRRGAPKRVDMARGKAHERHAMLAAHACIQRVNLTGEAVRRQPSSSRALITQLCICTSIISPLTIHGQPNLSVTMPKRLAQNVGPKVMVTLPPSASALNTRSAAPTSS